MLLAAGAARARRRDAAAKSHGHLRQPAFLAIAAAGKPDPGEPCGLLRLRDARLERARDSAAPPSACCGRSASRPRSCCSRCAGRLPKAVGPITLIAIGAAGGVVRWTAMTFDPPAALLFPLQFLHALSFGATHLGTMMYLSQNAPEAAAPPRRATSRPPTA